ncbi:hypothetical protein WBN73_13910 [Paenarthrobacter sp. CCNWLY172]|uniref:hypothetical protein n=1 Tax=unclassified Paenarthrobacter TaxID=2634190 RepID=UPI003076BF45
MSSQYESIESGFLAPEPHESRSESSGPGFIRTYTPEQRRRILDSISRQLNRVEDWHARRHAQPLLVRRGSLLDAADELARPFQASHKIKQQLTNAIDHLHALRALLVNAGVQHIYAPYTLIRPALEGAVGVLFIFMDATPQSVALRTLRDEHSSILEMHKAAITIGVPEDAADAEKAKRTKLIDDVIDTASFRKSDVKGATKSMTKKMELVTRFYHLGPMPHSMWQICSAASHGTRWALPMLAMFDADDDGKSPTITGQIVSDEATILRSLMTACDVLERAFTVVDAHCLPTGHNGQSFIAPRGLQ